eukprot:COSAG02_NODE_837_length_16637_cov_5.797859_3_plen_282_part_00
MDVRCLVLEQVLHTATTTTTTTTTTTRTTRWPERSLGGRRSRAPPWVSREHRKQAGGAERDSRRAEIDFTCGAPLCRGVHQKRPKAAEGPECPEAEERGLHVLRVGAAQDHGGAEGTEARLPGRGDSHRYVDCPPSPFSTRHLCLCPSLAPTSWRVRCAGKTWHELSDDGKKPYEDMAAKDKARFDREMATYTPSAEFTAELEAAKKKTKHQPRLKDVRSSALALFAVRPCADTPIVLVRARTRPRRVSRTRPTCSSPPKPAQRSPRTGATRTSRSPSCPS